MWSTKNSCCSARLVCFSIQFFQGRVWFTHRSSEVFTVNKNLPESLRKILLGMKYTPKLTVQRLNAKLYIRRSSGRVSWPSPSDEMAILEPSRWKNKRKTGLGRLNQSPHHFDARCVPPELVCDGGHVDLKHLHVPLSAFIWCGTRRDSFSKVVSHTAHQKSVL